MLYKLFLTILCFYTFCFIADSKLAVKKYKLDNNGIYQSPTSKGKIQTKDKKMLRTTDDCWITLDAKKHFEDMEELESTYKSEAELCSEKTADKTAKFDEETIERMLASRARLEGKGSVYEEIPAGLNLGGYSIIRMPKSLLFFHRMKLRNMTRFIIQSLKTNLDNMTIKAELNLRDLHLIGDYERAVEAQEHNELLYVPTYGMAEILLKNVKYSVEGRLRYLYDSPYIVLMVSSLSFERALLMYRNHENSTDCDESIELTHSSIENFMDRMKADLDNWLKDFFNHQLIFFKPKVSACRVYQKKRMIIFNEYIESSLNFLKKRIHEVNASVVMLPSFNIVGHNGLEIALKQGRLRGLDSIYRRSVATGTHVGKIRTVDAVVGFSNLKVVYKFTTYFPTDTPPLNGLLILSADELTAQMYISLIKDPETVDIVFDSLKQMKEEMLTVEGPTNRLIGNFKHILENHIISIMSNALLHNIRLLRTLTKCEPSFIGYNEYDDLDTDGNAEIDGGGKADYVINKEDSVEVELSPKDKYHMKLKETLLVEKLN